MLQVQAFKQTKPIRAMEVQPLDLSMTEIGLDYCTLVASLASFGVEKYELLTTTEANVTQQSVIADESPTTTALWVALMQK